MEKTKKIDGFLCTFMEYDDGDSNNCYVEKGRFHASLALLQHLGEFDDGEGNSLPIHESTIDKIEQWAILQGY